MKPKGHELWVGRTILSALVIFTVAPFVAMLSTALQPAGSSPAGLSVPNPPHFENFKSAFELAEMPTLLWSSTLLVVMVVPIAVVFASLAAYGMVIVRAPAAPLAFAVLLIGLTIPFEGLITPLYYQIRDLDLLNTRWGIALPLIALYMPFGVFWMRAHFTGVPRELDEAAAVDGASLWQALWRVHWPLARPAVASLAVLFSLWTWNQFIIALVMMDDPLRRTMAGALGAFQGRYGTDVVLLSAGALLIMLPTIIVFVLFQKHFVTVLLQGSIKG